MIKPILCFDFDGTLVDANGRIHPRDVAILRDNQEAYFLPATGRPLHSVRRTFARNGLDWPAIPFWLALENGATVYMPGERLYASTPFVAEETQALIDACLRHDHICSILFGSDGLQMIHPSDAGLRMLERFDLETRPFDPGAISHSYTKITSIAETVEDMRALADEVSGLSVETSFSLPTVFELTRRGIDKGQVVRRLVADWGLQDAPLLVAGDGENDLPLFAVADHTFCPSNAPAAIQAAAEHIVDVAERGILEPMLFYAT